MVARLAIHGAGGRMGKMLVEAARADNRVRLVALLEHAVHPELGKAPSTGLPTMTTTDQVLWKDVDVVIDFSTPEAGLRLIERMAKCSTSLVIGTTGFSADQQTTIRQAARSRAMVLSSNMSLGVTLLANLVEAAARALPPSFDIDLVEMHHRQKRDAPSGTALLLGEAAANGRGTSLSQLGRFVRQGEAQRQPGEIGVMALRGGDVVGEHTVFFAGDGERIELTHRATDRSIFAKGAIEAAIWVTKQPAGLYTMKDLLGV